MIWVDIDLKKRKGACFEITVNVPDIKWQDILNFA